MHPAHVAQGFKTGAIASPRHVLLGATPHRPTRAPAPVAYVPKQLSFWKNNVNGCCVTSSEAFAKACYSPEIFIPDTEVTRWATAHGVLEGAVISDVLDWMVSDGFVIGSQKYDDGGKQAVDFSSETALASALNSGPLKIGIDASALPPGAGNGNGWYATGGRPGQFRNLDHCVELCGWGMAQWLFGQLGVPFPSSLSTSSTGLLLFTWDSIGFVDPAWVLSCCGEAWLRSPTTVGNPPLGPDPTPNPTPVPPSPPTWTPDAQTVTLCQSTMDGVLKTYRTRPLVRDIQSKADAALAALLTQGR